MAEPAAPTWSLQRRLWRRLLGLLVAGWLAACCAAAAGLWHEIDEVLDGALQQTALRLLALPDPPLGATAEPTTQAVARGPWSPGEHGDFVSYQLYDASGHLRLRSAGAPPDAPMDPQGRDGLRETGRWHVLTLNAPDGRRVHVAETIAHRREVLWHSLRWMLLALLAVLPALALALRWLIQRVFSSVEAARHALETLDVGRLEPLALPRLPDELQPWLRGTNALLARLRTVVEAERALALHVAHEVRTPLAAARAQAQRLLASVQDEQSRGHVQALLRQLDRLGSLTTRRLHVARLESGIALRREPVDLGELARLVAGEFDAEQRRGRLRLHAAPRALPVHGDIDALAIALRNLVANALRHGGERAQVDVIAAPGLLAVQDDGPGVDPALLPSLVRRFERGPGAAEGSGLGLAIVDAIARQSGARLVLQSPVVQGRGFRAELRF
jgi:two-component system OmpR family sensor kinase